MSEGISGFGDLFEERRKNANTIREQEASAEAARRAQLEKRARTLDLGRQAARLLSSTAIDFDEVFVFHGRNVVTRPNDIKERERVRGWLVNEYSHRSHETEEGYWDSRHSGTVITETGKIARFSREHLVVGVVYDYVMVDYLHDDPSNDLHALQIKEESITEGIADMLIQKGLV